MKNIKKKLFVSSYSKNMANFEVFHNTISSSINLLFLKSGLVLGSKGIHQQPKIFTSPNSHNFRQSCHAPCQKWTTDKRMIDNGRVPFFDLGRIHLPHIRILKYFMDDLSINFHDKVFLHFLSKFGKKRRKTMSWKFTDESSVRYLLLTDP